MTAFDREARDAYADGGLGARADPDGDANEHGADREDPRGISVRLDVRLAEHVAELPEDACSERHGADAPDDVDDHGARRGTRDEAPFRAFPFAGFLLGHERAVRSLLTLTKVRTMKEGIWCLPLRGLVWRRAPARASPPVPSATATPEAGAPAQAKRFDYPDTPQEDVVETLHGKVIHDWFRWLEDGSAPKVKAWAAAEDAYARARLSKLPERDAIKERLAALFYVDQQSAPDKEGKRYFWSHRDAKQEKGVVWWKEGKTGTPKVLLDPNTWSTDGSVALGAWQPSHDGVHLAYLKKEHNSDEATLYVMEVATGKVSTTDVIEGAKYAGVSWNAKGTASTTRAFRPFRPR